MLIGDGPQRPPVERYLERHAHAGLGGAAGPLVARRDPRGATPTPGCTSRPPSRESFGIAALEARVRRPARGGQQPRRRGQLHHARRATGGSADDDAAMVRAMVRLLTDRAGDRRRSRPTTGWPRADLDWPAASARALDAYARAGRVAAAGRRPTSSLGDAR